MHVNKILPICNSPIGWVGGKTKLRPTILSCFAPHTVYVEVFCGSATVFFGKQPSKIEVINDINEDLSHLMEVIAGVQGEKVRKQFISYVRDMPASRSTYEKWSKETKKTSSALRAFKTYYCIKNAFSCKEKGGYSSSPFTTSRYNQKTDFEPFTRRFRENNAQIERLDFRELIKKYNRPGADVLFFMDPPYFVATDTNYYKHLFTQKDHEDLRCCCENIDNTGNKFLLTYDDTSEVEGLYAGYYIYRTDPITYMAKAEREERHVNKSELFITNYDIAKMLCGRTRKDIFAEKKVDDNRIDIPGSIGLERTK